MEGNESSPLIYTGKIFDYEALEKSRVSPELAPQCRYEEDGALAVVQGKIAARGPKKKIIDQFPNASIKERKNYLLMPGFIDAHVHFPQMEVMGSFGASLLSWLTQYTYPAEMKFADLGYAKKIAKLFIHELLRHGTSSAFCFATIHKEATSALFSEAQSLGMRLISGKMMMDRHAPAALLDTPESSYEDSEELIKKWHRNARLLYAATPRFAPTSSEAQLEMVEQLKKNYKDIYIQTHLAENTEELAWVKKLFPSSRSYLDVYQKYGLVTPNSIFAHGIYLDHEDLELLHAQEACMVHCPSSNLFLGSGLFPLKKTTKESIGLALGSDVGGGTSFSMLNNLQDAYKISALNGYTFNSLYGFFLLTLGGAQALSIDNYVGNFDVGKEADFIVVDLEKTPVQRLKAQQAESIEDLLFSLMILGDDRNIVETYIMGKKVYSQKSYV